MWSLSTNNVFAAILTVAWVLFAANYIGDLAVPMAAPAETAATQPADKATSGVDASRPPPSLATLLAAADLKKGRKMANKCISCHTFDKGGKNKIGPNLYNILGAEKAARDDYGYSNALKSAGGAWSYEDMDAFIRKPKAFAPGTKMTFGGIKDATSRADLILYLRAAGDSPPPLP